MTLKEAHKRLDEEYERNVIATVGIRKAKIPDSVRVTVALLTVAEVAKAESTYFSMPKETERDCDNCIHRKDNGCESWDCHFERIIPATKEGEDKR